MKTLVMTVMMAVTGLINVTGANGGPDFAYSTKVENGQMTAQTVYKVEDGKYLKQHLMYGFDYDAENRLIRKEVFKWDVIRQVYERSYCLNYTYEAGGTEMELALWNAKEAGYTDVKQKVVYLQDGMGITYLAYEWDSRDRNWNLLAEHPLQNGDDACLLAGK